MTDAAPVYFKGAGKFRGISAFTLKIIAIVCMTSDHASAILTRFGLSYQGPTLFGLTIWRVIGRIAFPIFCFMIAEGARRSRNVNKYLLRLTVFALISEIPFDIAFFLSSPTEIVEFGHQNVFFTLALGLAAIRVYQLLKERNAAWAGFFTTAAFSAAAYFLSTDYSWSGVVCIFLMYLAADKPNSLRVPLMLLAAFVPVFSHFRFNSPELFALLGVIPIALYNGEKGRKTNKYLFYAYYPAHLLLLYFGTIVGHAIFFP